MPKYYRFRVSSPTRKLKRSSDKDKEINRSKTEAELSYLDLTLACTPAPSWYLRRTSWRESPPVMGLPRQLASVFRASLQLNNRPIFVFKMPPNGNSMDLMRPF